MAVLPLVELIKGVSDPVAAGVIENVITADQLTAQMPFRSLGLADSITYRREKTLPGVSKPASGGSITADNALEFTRAQSFVRRLVVDQDIDILDSGASGGLVQARAAAIAAAAKAIGRTYGLDIINGNANWTVAVNTFGGTGYTAATIVVGPGHDPRVSGGLGTLRYTHSGTTLKYKAPGDAEFGALVSNAASIKLHERFGFELVGVFRGLGRKHGRWLDTVQMQRALGDGADTAPSNE